MQAFLLSAPHEISISPIRNLSAAKQLQARIPSLEIAFSEILEKWHADYDWPQGASDTVRETPRILLSRAFEAQLVNVKRRLHALESVYEVHQDRADWLSSSDPYLRDLEIMMSMSDEEAANFARIAGITVEEVRFRARSKYESSRKSRIEHMAICELCADDIALCEIDELDRVASRCRDIAMRIVNFSNMEEYSKEFLSQLNMRWGAQSA